AIRKHLEQGSHISRFRRQSNADHVVRIRETFDKASAQVRMRNVRADEDRFARLKYRVLHEEETQNSGISAGIELSTSKDMTFDLRWTRRSPDLITQSFRNGRKLIASSG